MIDMTFKNESMLIGNSLHLNKEDVKRYLPHLCQSDAMAEDHSERMTPYEGDAGDETN